MSLHKIKDFDPDYRKYFDNQDIIGFDLYSGNDKVGSVENILVDDNGSFRYFVIHTGTWILGKKTLLPIGRARFDASKRRVDVDGLSRSQIESLPEFDENSTVDYEHEERTRGVYRPAAATLGTAAPNNAPTVPPTAANRDSYDYKQDSDLYDLNDHDHQNLKLYEERLVANKTRQKTGEVAIGKHVETETAKVAVSLDQERVVIERTPGDAKTVAPGEANFQSGEVARIEVYQETPDIHKEAFVREEVSIRKEVDRETVQAEEQLRREELDVDKEGRTIMEQEPKLPSEQRAQIA
jgi:uncharacterized protein (TIGR02271 family)